MRARATILVLALLLFLLPSASFALDEPCATCNKVFLQPSFDSQASVISVRALYMNFSYYNEIQHVATRQQDFSSPEGFTLPPEVLNNALNANISPLEGANLSFKLESFEIVDSANNPVCDGILTDADGNVQCRLSFFRNSSGAPQAIENLSRCMNVIIDYAGHTNGKTYKPAQATVLVCGKQNTILTAVGRDITNQIDQRKDVCVPIFIVLGLLLAAMYYSGRNPLSLFDITTPRLPATRKFRMARTGVMVGFTEKNVMSDRITKLAKNAMASMLAREISKNVGSSRGLSKEQKKKIMKKVEGILNGPGSPDAKHKEITSYLEKNGVNLKDNPRFGRVLHQLIATHDLVSADKYYQRVARGTDYASDGEAKKGIFKYLSTENVVKQASKVSGNKIIKKIPGVNYVVGNLAIITAQNARSLRAARLTRRESIGGFAGATLERTGLAAKVKPNTWLGNKVGGIVEKYGIEKKKISAFEDPRYKLVERALHLQEELRIEEIRKLLHRIYGAELAAFDKEKGKWVLNGKLVPKAGGKQTEEEIKKITEKQAEFVRILNCLSSQPETASPEGYRAYYQTYIKQLLAFADGNLGIKRNALQTIHAIGSFTDAMRAIDEQCAMFYKDKNGKFLRDENGSLRNVLQIAGPSAKDGKQATSLIHLDALDPHAALLALKSIEKHISSLPDSRIGRSTIYNALEDIASGKYKQATHEQQAARAWLLTLVRSCFQEKSVQEQKVAELSKLLGDKTGADFRAAMRSWLNQNQVAKTKLHEMDQWDIRRIFDALPHQSKFDSKGKSLLLPTLDLLRTALESEHAQRSILSSISSLDVRSKLFARDFEGISAAPLGGMEEFRGMRMTFERAIGRKELKMDIASEWSLWMINRLQGKLESGSGANMFSYYDRHSERLANTMQWMNNWWLANIDSGQKALAAGQKRGMNAEEYTALMNRGVLYGDLRSGIWVSTSDFRVTPYAILGWEALQAAGPRFENGSFSFSNKGKLVEAWQEAWKKAYVPMLSESERLLNAHVLVNKGNAGADDWRKSNPYKDREASMLLNDAGIGGKLRKGATDLAMHTHEKLMLVSKDMFLESDKFKTTAPFKWMGSVPLLNRMSDTSKFKDRMVHSVGGYLEAVSLASTYHNSRRLQDWFVMQAAVRATLEDYGRALNRHDEADSGIAATKELHDYRVAKQNRDNALAEYNGAKERLLSQAKQNRDAALAEYKNARDSGSVTAVELAKLKSKADSAQAAYRARSTGGISAHELEQFKAKVNEAEREVKKAASKLGETEKQLYQLHKQEWDYWQTTERASMRDPRVAHSGIGTAPAFASGYHTGQWIYEPAESVFAFGILPGQDVLRTLYRIPYRALYTFTSQVRPLFSMAGGYPVRSDINEAPPDRQSFRLREILMSPFRFSNIDWFHVQWNKPRMRSSEEYTTPLQYNSFMGFNIKESFGTQARYLFPITTRAPTEGTSPETAEAFRTKMLRRGWTKDQIDDYLSQEKYAAGTTYEREMKRMLASDNYEQPSRSQGILRPLFTQGYYAATKRTGDAYIAHGESMRDYEFYSTVYRNMSKAFPPGMMYQDWEGRQHMAPRLANYMLNMTSTGAYGKKAANILAGSIPHKEGSESYYAMIAREANADIFVRGTNAIALAAERDNEARFYSMWNFPASMMALSPGMALVYNFRAFGHGPKDWLSKFEQFEKLMPRQKPEGMPSTMEKLAYTANEVLRSSTWDRHFYDNAVTCSHCGLLVQKGTKCPNCEHKRQVEANHNVKLHESMKKLAEATKQVKGIHSSHLEYFQ